MAASRDLLTIVAVLVTAGVTEVVTQTCRSVTTFNAGLTPRIPQYESRSKDVGSALLQEDSDIVCLQEFWFEKDIDHLLKKVSWKYPYHFSGLHHSVGKLSIYDGRSRLIPKTPCTPGDMLHFSLRILPCVILKGCITEFGSSMQAGLGCTIRECIPHLNHTLFSANCFSCVSLTATSLTNLFEACQPQLHAADNRMNKAGLMILSKEEITQANFQEYFPGNRMTIPRAFLDVGIKDFGTVACTHLSAIFNDYFEFDLPFDGYKEQQAGEVGVLQDYFGSRDHVLAADFNTGPRVDAAADPQAVLVGEAPDNFQLLQDMGYTTTYLTDDGRCTFCRDNYLTFNASNNAIDYVMFKGNFYPIGASRRTLDPPIPLSDHYGVTETLCRP